MIESGSVTPLGPTIVDGGVNFSVFSSGAERVELCLFDETGRETDRRDLRHGGDGVWCGLLSGAGAGQQYGYRAHGPYSPADGLRYNAAKLLIDPYAKALAGGFRWSHEVFDFDVGAAIDQDAGLAISTADSAPFVPRSVVTAALPPAAQNRPALPWCDVVVYEANVRGYTMRHPDIDEGDRGRFRGMSNGRILEYLKALGITSIELQPVFEFLDEQFLDEQGLRNYWGYNTLSFFAPAGRYAGRDPRGEFREMVAAMHDAGFEVILDVAYNHTAESGSTGPTLSFRGLDNLHYYRVRPGDPSAYINDTGTGNTLNADSPQFQALVLDSLRYWSTTMGVDGFRFDLAPVLGRHADGYSRCHPLLRAISEDPVLSRRRLIAEPWDPGPGGYQLGNFPGNWAEWNDRYRDSVRRFWRGDPGEASEFARRLHGSSDVFGGQGRGPSASVNFITAHDGFTLQDLVSFERRHNEANGEDNSDGHAHNYSANYGVEGATERPDVVSLRRQQRLNMLATLLLSQGTPMLLAGDEIGNSQDGNNNVYAQDNPTGWIDWSGRDDDPQFLAAIRALIDLRRDIPLFRSPDYLNGLAENVAGWGQIQWLRPDGRLMGERDWHEARCLSVVLSHTSDASRGSAPGAVLLMNASDRGKRFTLPDPGQRGEWQIRFVSAARGFSPMAGNRWKLPAKSLVCVTLGDARAAARTTGRP